MSKDATNAVETETDSDGNLTRTFITFELPPGEYTIQVNDVFQGQDIVFEDEENAPDNLVQQIDVDLTSADDEITMVVPIQIQLAFGDRPNLMDIFDTDGDGDIDADDDFYELLTNEPTDDPAGFGLSDGEITALEKGLEEYMFYYAPDLQTHTYAIQATANGRPVEDYTLAVTDEVSQLSEDAATQQTLTISALFDALLSNNESELNSGDIPVGLKSLFSDEGVDLSDDATVKKLTGTFENDDGTDKWMIIDGDDTYFLQADGDQLHVDTGTYEITGGLPAFDSQSLNVLKKSISFQALKDGYRASDTQTDDVTVLGDRLQGTASQIVSIPNINYLVLHDPPGDGSYAFVEDDLTVKGIVAGMRIKVRGVGGLKTLPVFPAPWSVERRIRSTDLDQLDDLESKGLLGTRGEGDAGASFIAFSAIEIATGTIGIGAGPGFGIAAQYAKALATGFTIGTATDTTGLVQYEISVNRELSTPSGDSLSDLMGPGRGDIYFGEGWTLGFQGRHRFGLMFDGANWKTETQEITTYDILDRTNQYIYTTLDIENIIDNLDGDIAGGSDVESDDLTAAQDTWLGLLEKNIAYQWSKFYIENADKLAELEAKESAGLSTLETFQLEHLQTAQTNIAATSGDTFEAFRKAMGLPEDSNTASENPQVETLIFSAGPEFSYSRTISEALISSFLTSVQTESEAGFGREDKITFGVYTPNSTVSLETKLFFQMGVQTEQGLSGTYDSGQILEQEVGFVLQDDDIGDNIATRVYRDPVWGTPLFIHDLGSVTSDPWSPGTNKAVDVRMELIAGQLEFLFSPSFTDSDDIDDLDSITISTSLQTEFMNNGVDLSGATVEIDREGERWIIIDTPDKYIVRLERKADLTDILNVYQETVNDGPFDYHEGAHYTVRVTYTGQRVQSATVDFVIYAYPTSNTDSATARFNGDRGPYEIYLAKTDSFADIEVSIFPPEIDQNNSFEREYSVVIEVDEIEDAPQIFRTLTLTPRFADLQPPTAEIVTPYDGERISPAKFNDADDTFSIKVITEDSDISNISIQSRSKRQDGVWGNWSLLGGLSWTDGVDSAPTDLGGNPTRFRYTFEWESTDINTLGVGSYQLRALASDKAGNPTVADNDLPTAPTIEFLVDASEPTVLTTIPNYQDSESERTYKGELSVVFTDDMTEHDFTSDTFEVMNLLQSDPLLKQVSGFVSYSPALRKAIFVPEVPFQSNGFYKVTIKTDNVDTGEDGVHDLAGNPLDNEFSWTFRTTDSLFEETWELTFAVEAGSMRDGNNIAAVEVGEDVTYGDDERDAQAVPSLSSQLRLSFLHADLTEYDRDTHPADGRVSHHWFFVVDHGDMSDSPTEVTLLWKPSIEMTQAERDYQFTRLIGFEADARTVRTVTPLDPTQAVFDVSTGEFEEMTALTYTPNIGEQSRYFRLDVRKSTDYVAQDFEPGTSNWLFFAVPIGPTIADPYVNLGDDFDSFQLYDYDTVDGGYHVYPLDLDRDFGLRAGRAYFTRFDANSPTVQVDVGGTSNLTDIQITLSETGWHPVGNPFTADVNVSALLVNGAAFPGANNEVDATLYRWVLGQGLSFKTVADRQNTADALDGGAVDAALTQAFTDQALTLSSPTVTAPSPGQAWEVVDGNDSYNVTYNGLRFKVDQMADHYQAVDSTGVLQSWDGYWIQTNEVDVTLTIPVPENLDTSIEDLPSDYLPPLAPSIAHLSPQVQSKIGRGFALRMALTSDFAADLITELGTDAGASAGKDAYDTSEPPTLGKTVSAYFNHPEWGDAAGRYNTDYQPPMEVGETRTWGFTVFTDKPKAEMELSWNAAQLPEDTMFFIRRTDDDLTPSPSPGRRGEIVETGANGRGESSSPLRAGGGPGGRSAGQGEGWLDMRKVPFVSLVSTGRITKIPFEVRAQRFDMSPVKELKASDAGDQVVIRWKPSDNAFIEDYIVEKQRGGNQKKKRGQPAVTQSTLPKTAHQFVDAKVAPGAVYLYEITTRFLTGATVVSDRIRIAPADPLEELKVTAGEKQVKFQCKTSKNPFIAGYEIVRHAGAPAQFGVGEATRYTQPPQPEASEMEFVDTEVEEEADYTYQVLVRYQNDHRFKSELFPVTVLPIIKATVLLQNYPNPFNPETWLPYDLEKEAEVSIEIYNISGQLVRTLPLGFQTRGRYQSREKAAYWDGRNQFGERTASGVYFYLMRAGDYYKTRKMAILK